ncbi:hypothetical protein KIN20_023188 [Parelaphostrongylus tenuis]|uniref:DnaJ homolog subfamily C member 1 n=1 Tax=Parelaphostrongylus tenuis TaxID=148309 RepID=A0AAD5QSS8_PARTN|nr:hypothetical protein KIN20_023188 [Parelaphostrongylus tenuis]
MRLIVLACFLLGSVRYATASWNSEELSLYDLVEAVNSNFYELFGITKDASTAEVKKAYRRLSLEWHPDRNDAPEATAKFRQIVSIYEVLKSTELRAKYDNVLEYGLPDWRQPIYYYRKMRKLSWYEAILVLIIVSTIAHYFMMWASYYEKYLVLSQTLRKSKKRDRKEESEGSSQQLRAALSSYRPQFQALLPFLIAKGLWRFFVTLGLIIRERMTTVEPVEEENIREYRRTTSAIPPREFTYEVATDLKAVSPNDPELYAKYCSESEENIKKQSGDIWSCEELYQLVRLTTEKFPSGTPNRWERVACVLNRSAQDVTAMAAKLKQIKREDFAKLAMGQQSNAVFDIRSGKATEASADRPCPAANQTTTEWSQIEQKQLEMALQRYPKGCENRWDNIAAAVPTKSKEQCQERLKELVELVRRKKLGMT